MTSQNIKARFGAVWHEKEEHSFLPAHQRVTLYHSTRQPYDMIGPCESTQVLLNDFARFLIDPTSQMLKCTYAVAWSRYHMTYKANHRVAARNIHRISKNSWSPIQRSRKNVYERKNRAIKRTISAQINLILQ